MAFARIFQKTPRLIRRRPNCMFQMQDFESYNWQTRSRWSPGFSAMVSSPTNCHFAPSFIFSKKKISKNFRKNALDIIRALFKMMCNAFSLKFFEIFNFFLKKLQKECVGHHMIKMFLKDASITIDFVPQLKFFLVFLLSVTPFCKNKGSRRLDPNWNFFCCEPLKCSGPNKVVSENIYL